MSEIASFATARVVVKQWSDAETDQRQIFDELPLILTPTVLAPLPPSMQFDAALASAEAWLSARAAEAQLMILRDRSDDAIVGLLMLVEDGLDSLHIGYLFRESAWGKGLATELLRGLVAHLQPRAPLRLIAGVGQDNPASARVLEKAGFRRDEALSTPDTDMFILDLAAQPISGEPLP